MSTIYKILDTFTETLWEFVTKYNNSLENLNTDKAELSGATFTWNVSVPDAVYSAGWDGNMEVPTKNAIYDKIQSMPALSDWDKGDITVSASGATWTIDNNVVTNAKQATVATNTIKGRTTAWTGNVEDLTPTQVAWMLPVATTSVAGTMSASDKTKLDWLTAFIWCRVSNSSNQTLTADTYLAPVWNTEDYDVWGFHTWSNNYFTIPTTWYYIFTFNLNLDWETSGNFNLYITKNSDSSWIMSCQTISWVSASFADWVSVSWVLKCTSWDTVNAWVHLSGTSGNTRTMLATNSFFSASLIWI